MMQSSYDELVKQVTENKSKIDNWDDNYEKRLNYELEIIGNKGFEDYFLILQNSVQWSRDNGILVGPGRGSSAGSLVAFLLGITMIDPLKYDLMFERFLNPSRPDLPDIDVDFQASRRGEVFDQIRATYGDGNTCFISTFSKFHAKQAIRDLCRIFDIPIKTSNKLGSAVPNTVKTMEDAMKIREVSDFMEKYPEIHSLAYRLEGAIRQRSIHPAGIIITPGPISKYIAIEKVKGEHCSCFDMEAIDYLGLLKIDVLSLRTLDVIARALELTGLKYTDLPLDPTDDKVFEIFKQGLTLGVFQFESSLLTGMSKKLQISDFKTLYAATTIARPGPLHSGETKKYIKRHLGEARVEYLTPELEPITGETYGLLLYQEQTMKVAVQLAGFTEAESETLRKIIGKSKGKGVMDEYRDKFVSGCVDKGIKQKRADKLWSILRESSKYSFNKCLTGDTILYRGSAGRNSKVEITIEELYQNWNSKTSVGAKYRNPNRGITICALDKDGRIRPKRVKGVYLNGKQKVYEIRTSNGRKIKATKNHRFMNSNFEWKEVSQFNVGDAVIVMGTTESVHADEMKKWNFTGIQQENKHKSCPGKEGFQGGELNPGYINRQYMMFQNAQIDLLKEGRYCRICDNENERMEFHHIDGNHRNNERNNLTLLCVSCHKKEEYRLGRRKRGERGRLIEIEEIVSINFIGEEETYDLEMDTLEHNFVANGFISHNSHAVAYSLVSYWCAWLKACYPKEFLVALMEFESDDIQGNATRELREMGYSVLPPDINKSKGSVRIASDGEIYMGLSDVAGVGEKAVEEILGKQPFDSFDDFMGRVQKRRANSRVVRNLIQAGAFDSFSRRDMLFYTLDDEPYQEWDDEEMIKRQMMVLDIPASTPLIDHYDNPYERQVNITPIKDIDFTEKIPDVWVKGILLDFSKRKSANTKLQDFFGEVHQMGYFYVDDGTKKTECFIAPEQLLLYEESIVEGDPVLLKCHTYGKAEKLYVDAVVNLHLLDKVNPTLKEYLEDRRELKVENVPMGNYHVDVISSANYQTSKNGKNYARILFESGEEGLCFNLTRDIFRTGEILCWRSTKKPFVNIVKRIL